MKIKDYDNLKTVIADYLNRADLETQIPLFIQLAEGEMRSKIRLREQIVRSAHITTALRGFANAPLPSNWGEAIVLRLAGGEQPLRFINLDQAHTLRGCDSCADIEDIKYFSLMANTVELIPNPTFSVTVEMTYYQVERELANETYTRDVNGVPTEFNANTNAILNNYPDVYLYGALKHAAPYLLDDPRMPMFIELFDSRMEELSIEAHQTQHSGSVLVASHRAF